MHTHQEFPESLNSMYGKRGEKIEIKTKRRLFQIFSRFYPMVMPLSWGIMWFGYTSIDPWPSQVVLVVKNLSANAGEIREAGSIPGSGQSPGGGHGNSFYYSCLENATDGGARWVTVPRAAKSRTQLKWLSTHTCI